MHVFGKQMEFAIYAAIITQKFATSTAIASGLAAKPKPLAL